MPQVNRQPPSASDSGPPAEPLTPRNSLTGSLMIAHRSIISVGAKKSPFGSITVEESEILKRKLAGLFSVALLLCCSVALLLCRSVALLLCRSVALSLCLCLCLSLCPRPPPALPDSLGFAAAQVTPASLIVPVAPSLDPRAIYRPETGEYFLTYQCNYAHGAQLLRKTFVAVTRTPVRRESFSLSCP